MPGLNESAENIVANIHPVQYDHIKSLLKEQNKFNDLLTLLYTRLGFDKKDRGTNGPS